MILVDLAPIRLASNYSWRKGHRGWFIPEASQNTKIKLRFAKKDGRFTFKGVDYGGYFEIKLGNREMRIYGDGDAVIEDCLITGCPGLNVHGKMKKKLPYDLGCFIW